MKDPKPFLEKDFAYHADMLDALLIKESEVIYSEDDGVMIRIGEWGPYAISAKTEEAMEKMAKLIAEKRYMAVVRPFKFLPKLFEIRSLEQKHLSFVCKNYDDDEDYIKSRIEYGMLGAFDESGNCAGFIGFHGEGSMGLLTVLPEYRRKGIGIALEAKNLNRRLSEGRIPFGHVVVGNEKSEGLQKKIGMEFSEKIVTWIFSDF